MLGEWNITTVHGFFNCVMIFWSKQINPLKPDVWERLVRFVCKIWNSYSKLHVRVGSFYKIIFSNLFSTTKFYWPTFLPPPPPPGRGRVKEINSIFCIWYLGKVKKFWIYCSMRLGASASISEAINGFLYPKTKSSEDYMKGTLVASSCFQTFIE